MAEEAGEVLDEGDDVAVVHPLRPDHAERARRVAEAVLRLHDGVPAADALVRAGLVPDEDDGAARRGLRRAGLEEVHDDVVVLEELDHAADLLGLLELRLRHDLLRAADLGLPLLGELGEERGGLVEDEADDARAVAGVEVAHSLGGRPADLLEREPGEPLVHRLHDAVEVRAPHLGVELGDDGLDEAAADGDDEHQARRRERDDVEPLEDAGGEARAEHDAEEVREPPEQPRGLAEELLGVAEELLDAGAEEPLLRGRDARPVHELVHEGAVPEVGRDAAGGGVGVVEVAERFERAERVPDRGRGEIHDAALGEGLRADRRRRLDELRDDGAQDDRFALAQRRALRAPLLWGRTVGHRVR